jgi:hypothetical protein
MTLAGHVACTRKEIAYFRKILEGRNHREDRRRWENNITINFKQMVLEVVDWANFSKNTNHGGGGGWGVALENITNPRAP